MPKNNKKLKHLPYFFLEYFYLKYEKLLSKYDNRVLASLSCKAYFATVSTTTHSSTHKQLLTHPLSLSLYPSTHQANSVHIWRRPK